MKTELKQFLYWVEEREGIRIRKANKWVKPWTDDKILQSYRFCNVRRMDDKVSRWLLQHWYRPHFNHPLMVPAVALARFVNKIESLACIGPEIFASEFWGAERYGNTLHNHKEEGYTVFNGAYMVRGNDGIDKIDCVINHYVCNVVGLEVNRTSMRESHARILEEYGFGSFMAGQIVADLRWAMKGTWADKYVWAPIGPGSKRGMNRIHDRPIKFNLKQEQFEDELIELSDCIQKRLPKIHKRLEAMDIQNCCCEFDKYQRAFLGEGRPKQLYQGAK